MTAALTRLAHRFRVRRVLLVTGLSALALGLLASAHASTGPHWLAHAADGDESPRISIGDSGVLLEGPRAATVAGNRIWRTGKRYRGWGAHGVYSKANGAEGCPPADTVN